MSDNSSPEVIIVGAGIAGAAAALELARLGVSFIGIDRAPVFGGTARRGGIGTSVAGTPFQAERGITDTWQRAVNDLRAEGNNPDLAWARFYYRRALKDVYGWYEDLGASFETVNQNEGDSVPRWHLPLGGGVRVMGSAYEKLVALTGTDCWRYGLTVRDLLRDGNAIVGVVVEDALGEWSEIRANSVVVATGGFGGNPPMSREASPRFRDVQRLLAGGNPDAQGDLHKIITRHGGLLKNMQDVYAYANGSPDYRDPEERRGVVVRNIRSCIWVNTDGQRFHDEDLHIAGRSATDNLLKQPGQTCWVILDKATLPEVLVQDHYAEPGAETVEETGQRFVENSPYFRSAGTLEALAEVTDLPVEALAKTVNAWNELVRSDAMTDPLTGRNLEGLRPLGENRWHAIRFFPLLRKTLGGVCTDLKCRVLDTNRQPIPGLFAAGELTGMGGGGMAGARPLEGLMAGGSLFSGRIAGRWAGRLSKRALLG